MESIQVSLQGESSQALPKGISAKAALEKLKGGVPPEVFAVKANGIEIDLLASLETDSTLQPLMFDSPEGKEIYRHSSTHIMAQAVKECFPSAQLTIGPAIEEGFFYDFAFERPFTPEDLEKIEARALEIIKRNLSVSRREFSKEEAIEFFKNRGEFYKVELIQGFPDGEPVSAYTQGDFVDLCRGPHLPATGYVKAFKILNSAGAYWRGDERNPMLQTALWHVLPFKRSLAGSLG